MLIRLPIEEVQGVYDETYGTRTSECVALLMKVSKNQRYLKRKSLGIKAFHAEIK